MALQRKGLGMVGICLVMIALAVAGLASDQVTRLLASGIDGLLLLLVCLMMGLLFLRMLFLTMRDEGWISARHSKQKQAVAAAPAAPAKTAGTAAAPAAKSGEVPAGVGEGK